MGGPLILDAGGSPAARQVRTLALSRAGFEIIEADNSAEAFRLVQQRKPDAAVLHVHLPGADPVELCRRIREAAPHIAVLHLSGDAGPGAQMLSLETAGADCLFADDVEPEVLAAQLRALLRPRRQVENLRVSLEGARVGTWTLGPGCAEFELSATAAELFGIPARSAVPAPQVWEAIHAEERARVSGDWRRSCEHGSEFRAEFRVVMPDGAARSLAVWAGLVAGKYCGIVQDVSVRKAAEEQAEITSDVEAEQRLLTLVEAIPQMVWVARADGALEYMNGRMLAYGNLAPGRIADFQYRDYIHPEDLPGALDRSAEAIAAGREYEVECRLLRVADGAWRWHLIRAVPVRSASGAIERWFGTCTDIESKRQRELALQRIEHRFRALWERNVIGLVTSDAETILDANHVFLQLGGFTAGQLLAGEIRWTAITPPEYRESDRQALERVLATGSCDPFEKEFIRADGRRVPVLIGITLLDREPQRFLCFVLDLTTRKELERKLVEEQKRQSTGVLAGGVAHDFNNLLTGILGNASLARDGLAPHSTEYRLIAEVIRAAQSAADLTRQMLAYSGKGKLFVRPLNLSRLIRNYAALLQSAVSRHVVLELDLADDLPLVEADSGQMQQVLLNLALNGAEAIGNRPGSVQIRTRALTLDEQTIRTKFAAHDLAPGEYVCVEVHDTGAGIDEATQARIFDPFFTTKFQGRGLGLAAVAGIVRGHRGAILVESAPGAGSVFSVYLPAAASRPAPSPREGPPADLRGSGGVLVVDDEEHVRNAARFALEWYGYTVWTAQDGDEALRRLNELGDRVTLILLDLTMPVMGGVEVLNAVRERRPDLPVLLSSGYSEEEAMARLGHTGATAFIQKPYMPAQLAAKLKQIRQ